MVAKHLYHQLHFRAQLRAISRYLAFILLRGGSWESLLIFVFGCLGPLWVHFGQLLAHLGALLPHLGPPLALLGVSLGSSWISLAHLGRPVPHIGIYWASLVSPWGLSYLMGPLLPTLGASLFVPACPCLSLSLETKRNRCGQFTRLCRTNKLNCKSMFLVIKTEPKK